MSLRELRGNIPQARFAEMLGVSLSTVVKWEAGRYIPNVENLQKIAEILNISIEDVIAATKTPIKKRHRGRPCR